MSAKTGKQLAMNTMIGMCVMMFAWNGVGWNTLSLYAGSVVEEFGIMRSQFMLCITIVSLTNALVNMFLYGTLASKLGMKKLITICGLAAILAFALFATARNIILMWVASLLFGFTISGTSITTINVVMARWFRKDPIRYCGYAQTCGSVGGILASTIWGLIIASVGWRPTFWISCGLSVLALVLVNLLYKGDPEELKIDLGENEAAAQAADELSLEDGPAYFEIFRMPKFYIMALAFFLFGLPDLGLVSNLAVFTVDLGYDSLSGTVVSVELIAQALSFLLIGRLVDRFGAKFPILFTQLILIVCNLIIILGLANMGVMYVIAVLAGFADGCAQLSLGAIIRGAFGARDFAKKMGTIASFCFLGYSIGPTILAYVFDITGSYQAGLGIMCVVAVCAIVMLLGCVSGKKKVKA